MDQLLIQVLVTKNGFVIVDDFSRYMWVFYLNDKSEVFNIFKSFVKKRKNEF
jgi:hypothetical protein